MKNFIIISIIIGFIFVVTKQNKEIIQLKVQTNSLKKELDSVNSEIFTKDIQISRYEYIMDRVDSEMTSNCRQELKKIVNETE